jgi:adenylate cyclase
VPVAGDFKGGYIAKSFLLSAVVCALAFLISRSQSFADLELIGYDFLVNHAGYAPPDSNVVLIDFDDETAAALQQYPIPRSLIAQVITKASTARPRVIGLDVFLSEPRGSDEDGAMQKALTDAGNVVVASQLGSGGLPSVNPLGYFCQPDPSESGFCKDGTPGAMGFGPVNMPIEPDGFIREMFLVPRYNGDSISFPLFLAQQYSGKAIQPGNRKKAIFLGRDLPYSDRDLKSVLIGRWNPAPVKRISAIDVLRGRANLAQELNDKLVLIGQGSDAAHDKYFTPVFRPPHRVLLSGAEIHATAIATLLSGPAISTLSQRSTWLAVFLSVWLIIWLTLQTSLRAGVALVGLALVVFYAGSQALFAFGHTWIKFLTGELALALSLPMSLGYEFIQERVRSKSAVAERQQIMQLFSRYVSTEVAAQIWERRNELALTGQERDATVVFTDIRSFTQLTAGKPSAAVLAWLNHYFTAMDEVIRQEGGFLNKFIGDGLMVLFGVPLTEGLEKDAWSAVRCGIRMVQRVDQLNRENQNDPNYLPITIGVGIHTGGLTCGSVGSQERLEYSVIGETVNLASRLESLTKDFHVPLVMSAATYDAVRAHIPNARNLGLTTVRGFDCPIQVYTVDINDVNLSGQMRIAAPQKVTR